MLRTEMRLKAGALREKGESFVSIQQALGQRIPKGTLSYWCNRVVLPDEIKKRLAIENLAHLALCRKMAEETRIKRRAEQRFRHRCENEQLVKLLAENKDAEKMALAILYLAEGSKFTKSNVTFGNSDPGIIQLFLRLFRKCCKTDENKFRCNLQCRADQDIIQLEKFWSETTKIPLKNFYSARIDARTIGKTSNNKAYKGVCRINYFSAEIYKELKEIGDMLTEGS